MSWLEILMIVRESLEVICSLFLSFGVCGTLIGLVVRALAVTDNNKHAIKASREIIKYFLIATLLGLPVLIPSPKALFNVRIGLLKWHLASPANVSKGAEHIERIAQKLECKYLGCETGAKEGKE